MKNFMQYTFKKIFGLSNGYLGFDLGSSPWRIFKNHLIFSNYIFLTPKNERKIEIFPWYFLHIWLFKVMKRENLGLGCLALRSGGFSLVQCGESVGMTTEFFAEILIAESRTRLNNKWSIIVILHFGALRYVAVRCGTFRCGAPQCVETRCSQWNPVELVQSGSMR